MIKRDHHQKSVLGGKLRLMGPLRLGFDSIARVRPVAGHSYLRVGGSQPRSRVSIGNYQLSSGCWWLWFYSAIRDQLPVLESIVSHSSSKSLEFTPTDKSLVVLVRDGDEDAAGVLYERYAKRVFGLVRSKLGTQLGAMTEPEDIVQSVFKSMFRGMQSGNYDAPPGTTLWNLLAVIAVRKLSNKASHHMAKRRDASRNVPLETEFDGVEAALEQASAEFLAVCIQESLELLRPKHRQILSLRIQGHTIDEISKMVGSARRTVERSLQNSRETLAESLLDER